MKRLMPLRAVVVEITHEAIAGDDAGVRRAVKSWHNRLATGSIPRRLIAKLGRELFLDLDAWDSWWDERSQNAPARPVGRPRNDQCEKNHFRKETHR